MKAAPAVEPEIPGIDVCGKTGSAQIASEEYEKAHKDIKDNAWFVGFAPCYKPEIIVAVLWENVGVHGQFAAPTARDIMKAYFDKKTRIAEAEAARQMQKSNPANIVASALLLGNADLATGAAKRVDLIQDKADHAASLLVKTVSGTR